MTVNARMHLDGCHFFAWVFENPDGDNEVTVYERTGTDLEVHSDSDCERCRALLRGAPAEDVRSVTVELPDDAKGAFAAVITAIAEMGLE